MKEARGESGRARIEVIPFCSGHLCLVKECELFSACIEDSLIDFKAVAGHDLCIMEEKIEARERRQAN